MKTRKEISFDELKELLLYRKIVAWDEDHILAAAWNILWAIEMRCKKPECVDTPWKEEKA